MYAFEYSTLCRVAFAHDARGAARVASGSNPEYKKPAAVNHQSPPFVAVISAIATFGALASPKIKPNLGLERGV